MRATCSGQRDQVSVTANSLDSAFGLLTGNIKRPAQTETVGSRFLFHGSDIDVVISRLNKQLKGQRRHVDGSERNSPFCAAHCNHNSFFRTLAAVNS
jgi:hypothetical protein